MSTVWGLTWQPSLYLLPTILAGLAAAVLATYAWRQRPKRCAVTFAGFTAGLSLWSLAYGIELGFASLGPMLHADRVAFVGSVIVPTAWVLLAVEYAGYEDWITRRRLGLLAVEPTLTLLLVWTNGAHGLIWRRTALDASGPVTTPALTFGPAYWANYAYSYLLLGVGILLLGGVVVRANRLHRRQSLVLLVGVVVPLGANVAFHVAPGANPVGTLDLTPFAFGVTGICFALALFRFRMLDLVPVARETVVERMDDGVVVLDGRDVVVDMNPTARRVLGEDSLGTPVSRTVIGSADGVVEGLVSSDGTDGTREYEVSTTTLPDFRGDVAGRFVMLRDITQLQVLRDHEQRLAVLNRVLRHNIRNDLNVVTGTSELLADELAGERREQVETIRRAAARIVDISEKARHVETTIGADATEVAPVDVAAVGRETSAALAEAYPGAVVEFTGPDEAWGVAVGREQLAVVLWNLGENAVEHNPTEKPSVGIRVSVRERAVTVHVADDGPGIPEAERAILENGRETPLEHGNGLGLWLVQWIAAASNGALSFGRNEAGGSVVSVELPRTSAPGDPADGGIA